MLFGNFQKTLINEYLSITFLFIAAFLFYTLVAGLSWYGYAPIAQIVSVNSLTANVTYSDLLFDLSAVPPLLSLLRKAGIDSGLNITYILSLFLLWISAGYLFSFASHNSNKICGYFLILVYLFSPATWLYNTYEYDPGMFVSLTIILSVTLFDFVKGKDKNQKVRLLVILTSGLALSMLSSKWTVIHTILLIIFALFHRTDNKRKIILLCLVSTQLILPIKNFLQDGMFSNSTWVGLNLAMVASSLPSTAGEQVDLYTWYMPEEKLAKLKNCDSRENLFGSYTMGCRYITASLSDLHISKERILNSPLLYLKRGVEIFSKNWLEFPDNYINSGMSYERLKFKTYQEPGNGRFYWWSLNMIIYYLIPLLGLIKLAFERTKKRKYFLVLLLIFITLNYSTMSLINGIELGRMKFYCFGFILLLMSYFLKFSVKLK